MGTLKKLFQNVKTHHQAVKKSSLFARTKHNYSATIYQGVTERVTKLLKLHDIKVLSKITNNLRYKICMLKDVWKPQDKKNVVYEINCNDYNASYIGEIGRTAK